MSKGRSPGRFLLLLIALLSPAIIIIWGELSEFSINLPFLPTINVSPAFLDLEQVLIGLYYLATPVLLLLSFRSVKIFREDNARFLVLVFVCIFSFGVLRYLEFVYDTNGPPAFDPFGNYYPLAFWTLPLAMTAAAFFLLSAKS